MIWNDPGDVIVYVTQGQKYKKAERCDSSVWQHYLMWLSSAYIIMLQNEQFQYSPTGL